MTIAGRLFGLLCRVALGLAAPGMLAGGAAAGPLVRLAAIEQPPYIAPTLPRQGYAAELVRSVLQRQGYSVRIDFYPAARARSLAQYGDYDGFIQSGEGLALDQDFLLSSVFPGAVVGLLKRRDSEIDYHPGAASDPLPSLRELHDSRIGVVRGSALTAELERAGLLNLEPATDDLQNLDKLAYQRIDLMLVDKQSAGMLMVLNRPHLIGKLQFLEPPLFRSTFRVAFTRRPPARTKVRDDFDRGLAALQRGGGVDAILAAQGLPVAREGKPGRTLRIATVNNPDMRVLQSLSGGFERRNPGLKLEWHLLDEHTLRNRLMADLALAEGRYDVTTIGSYETPIWGARAWLTPIDGLPPAYAEDDLLPGIRASLSYQDRLYALPFYGESSMTYYRTDLFRKAGLVMPAQPGYAQIRNFAERLNDPAAGIHGICLRSQPGWGENMTFLTPMVNAMGGRWFDERWQPQLTSEAWRRALTLYVEMLTRFGPPLDRPRGFNENLALFAEGHCAMWIDATVAAGVLSNPKRSRVAADVGFARAPIDTTAAGASWLWVWALAIPESSLNKSDARRFIEWATSTDYLRTVAAREGWAAVPPGTRYSTYARPEYQAAAPFAEQVLSAIQSATPQLPNRPYSGIQFVAIPEFPAIGHAVGIEVERALKGELSVDEALRAAQTSVTRQMRESGYLRH